MKKKPDKNIKSFSNFFEKDKNSNKILNLLFNSSKTVFNIVNSNFKIYSLFKENIFCDVKENQYVKKFISFLETKNKNNNDNDNGNSDSETETETESESNDKKPKNKFKTEYKNEIFNITNIICNEIFPIYHKLYFETKNIISDNNNLIYQYIKNNIGDSIIDNDNFDTFFKKFTSELINKVQLDNKNDKYIVNHSTKIIFNILRSFYLKNYNFVEDQIKKHIKINDKFNQKFIDDVKKQKNLFKKETKISSKKLVGIELSSDPNIISIISRRMIEKNNVANFIAPDVVVSIVNKTYDNIKSFFALKNKGKKANTPQFLGVDDSFILKFDKQSRKIIKIKDKFYVRLTLGRKIADNYIDIIGDTGCICLNPTDTYKRYIFGNFLQKNENNKKISKTKNYIVSSCDLFVEKNNKHIIEAEYMNIPLPLRLIQKIDENFYNNLKNYNHTDIIKFLEKKIGSVELLKKHDKIKINYNYQKEQIETNKEIRDLTKIDPKDAISIDTGVANLLTIYNPTGKQFIVKGCN